MSRVATLLLLVPLTLNGLRVICADEQALAAPGDTGC